MDNQKKEYTAPELKELGEFSRMTKYSVIGEDFDGALPSEENPDEIFGS